MDRFTLSRRSFVTVLGAAGVGSLLAQPAAATGLPAAALDPSTVRRVPDGLRFVVLTDTHADVDVPTNLANLKRVFDAVLAEDPRVVLNCGDITEYGHDSEFAAYRATIPDALFPRLRHVPGNHETRWDPTALESFERWFGPARYSFDADGIHFVALNPTQVLQEPGLFGPDELAWLHRDLASAGARTPSLLFQHYPIGGRSYYVNDADALLETIRPFAVRAHFAGHIHREENTHLNGLTQVTGRATKGQPLYYLVERAETADGADALVVQRVVLPAAGSPTEPTREDVAVIPLGLEGPGSRVGPTQVSARFTDDGTGISVAVTAAKAAASAKAKLYPQGVFGGSDDGVWVPLTRSSDRWSGTVASAGLPAGTHRVQIRVEDTDGAGIERTHVVVKAGDTSVATAAWELEVGGRVQGALAEHDGLVVAGSTNGSVTALRPGARRAEVQWQANVGAVYRAAAFAAQGTLVLVPSADHHLHALDTATGGHAWSADLGGPVLSAPTTGQVDGTEVVAVVAGDRLALLETAEGRPRWNVEIPVMSAGRPAMDGDRIIAGAGDGRAYAFDARTGARLWSFTTNTRASAYSRLIYGPWDDTVELLPDNGVLVSTVSGAWALDRSTGARRWNRSGSYIYAPSLAVGDRQLLLTDERGRATLVDALTGAATWTASTAPRVLNAGPVSTTDGSRALVVGTGGLLVGLDLASGTATPLRQLFTANTFSTPVLAGGQLVVGAQDGVVRGIAGVGA